MARQRSLLGLDVGTYSVKAVEMSSGPEGMVVTGLGWERIPSPDMVEETIHAVIANNNLKARRVVTAVSGRSVIVRDVPMTAMPPEELLQAVRYEADKYIPFDLDEVQLDCQQLGAMDDGTDQVRVLLVAAKRELLDEHIATLQSVGLTSAVVDCDRFALANAFEVCNSRAALAGEGEAVALVDIGAAKTSIAILRGSDVFFTRELYTAGNSLTDAVARRFSEDPEEVERMKEDPGEALQSMQESMVDTLEELANEIRLSFDYYENQYDQTVGHAYISGGSARFPGIVEGLGQVFEMDVTRFNPFDYVDVAANDEIITKEMGSDMVVALGLAARIGGM